MKIYRKIQLSVLLSFGALSLSAQSYDVTKAYFDNATFDTHFDYVTADKGNVAQEILDVYDWNKPTTPNYTIGGVYQFGTQKTFNGASVPASGSDGSTTGGGLALSTGWNQQLIYSHPVTLSPGKYTLVAMIYNCSAQTTGKNLMAWYPSQGTIVRSLLTSFSSGEWIKDEITFEIKDVTSGNIQLGLEAGANGSANSAKIIVDGVKLYRDTPLGTADVDFRRIALQNQITIAEGLCSGKSSASAETLNQMVISAKTLYADQTATLDAVIEETNALKTAILTYRYANPTGLIPSVTTNTNYACGSTMAFGRMSFDGISTAEVTEQGFCWSTTQEPTINDNRTTKYISNNGRIFWLNHLTPSTVYYMRPYVITKGYAVGYGAPVKVITLPKGTVSFSLRDGCPDDFVSRVKPAAQNAVDYWNNLTNIQGLAISIGYGSGTPTAECSYGGWMTIGPNQSNQKTGTILHEMLHAMGVGQHWIWYGPNSPLRETGTSGKWLGVRANRVLQFWNNDATATLTGDKIHLWPYGVNGANEDTGTDLLYIGNSLIAEAISEDGLPPTGGYAVPAYVFSQNDNVRYYIKNESESCGLYDSYLVENKSGNLVWKKMSGSVAAANDSTAWYVTYNPQNCFYQLRNVSTGHYMTYSGTGENGIVTTQVSVPSTNQNFHFLPSHVDAVNENGWSVKGFWMIHPEASTDSPKCLSASANGKTQSVVYSLADEAKTQRWIILTGEELASMGNVVKTRLSAELNEAIEHVNALYAVPHTENVNGTDEAFAKKIASVLARNTSDASDEVISSLITETYQAGMDFIADATPKSAANPFDLSYLIRNGNMENAEGWSSQPTINYSCAEYYQTTYDINQTVAGLPVGTYQVKAQAFQRPGTASTSYDNYVQGFNQVTAYLYANRTQTKICNIAADAQSSNVGGGESAVGTNLFVPNDMEAASKYFAKGLYDNGTVLNLTSSTNSIKFGLRSSVTFDNYWSIFDNFRLYYYGTLSVSDVTAVDKVASDSDAVNVPSDVYSVSGVLLRKHAANLDGLEQGMYIMKGKKIIKKSK